MSSGLLVKPTKLAASQIQEESRWWKTHRTKAPTLFRDELRRVFNLISAHPEVGAIAEDTELSGVRRILLAATHHYLYYRVRKEKQRVEVLALLSTSREGGPASNIGG